MRRETSPKRGQARTEAILDAALDLIGEIGYERVTVDAIAARAQASKMTMYRNWRSKAELVSDAIRHRSEGPAPRTADTGSLRGDLLASVDGIVRALESEGAETSLIGLAGAVRSEPLLRDLLRTQIEARCDLDGTAIAAQSAARGAPVPADRVRLALRLAVAYFFTYGLLHGEPAEPADRVTLVDRILLPAITSP